MNPATPAGLPEGSRRSHAVESLTAFLRSAGNLQILDLGGVSQANVDYVTGFGHRLYAEDILRAFDHFYGPRAPDESPDQRVHRFLDETFTFPDQTVDGALIWDTLQFLPQPVAAAVGERLYRILAPEAFLLACFHPDTGGRGHPCSFRVVDERHVQLRPRGAARPLEPFSTRAIEKFFQTFRTVKFFMTRESLQEVIIRR